MELVLHSLFANWMPKRYGHVVNLREFHHLLCEIVCIAALAVSRSFAENEQAVFVSLCNRGFS